MKIINRRAFVGAMGVAGASMLAGCAPEAKPADLATTGDAAAEGAEAAAAWAPVETNPEVTPLFPEEFPVIYSDAEVDEILNSPAVVTENWVYDDGTEIAPAYQMARNTINRNGAGFGSYITKDHQLDLMPYLFSEDEALAYSQMPHYRDFTAAEFAEASGRAEDECLAICNALADRALLRRIYDNGTPKFLTLDSEYGYYEAYVQNFDTEYIGLKDLNAGAGTPFTFLDAKYTMYRTVPVDLSVVVDGDYTEDDDWHAILDRHDTFAVSPCMCRVSTLIREGKAANTQEAMELFGDGMRDCNHPTETCLVTGKQAEWFIEIGAGRELTRDEAKALLQRSVDEGMILDCLYTKEAENICSCHADCCLYVGAVRMLNGGPALADCSHFELVHKKDDCIKCGMCEKQCPMLAIVMDDEGYPIVDSACVRCGQCATVCPQGVRGLKMKPVSEHLEIPEDLADYYEKKARVRASKGYLFDIESQEAMAARVAEGEAAGLQFS